LRRGAGLVELSDGTDFTATKLPYLGSYLLKPIGDTLCHRYRLIGTAIIPGANRKEPGLWAVVNQGIIGAVALSNLWPEPAVLD
jgi:hypothetical protein